jgi:hypothetical protein
MFQAEKFKQDFPRRIDDAVKAICNAGGVVVYTTSRKGTFPDWGEVVFEDGSAFFVEFHGDYHYGGNAYPPDSDRDLYGE